jgi:hypothetical protein
LEPFKDQIQAFFNGDDNSFAQMDIRTRQALGQKVAEMLKNPSANRTAEDLEFTKKIANVAFFLRQERDFYQPQRETVGVADRLMAMDPETLMKAFRKVDGSGQEAIVAGTPTGFTAKRLDQGVNSRNNFMITDIATGQKFLYKMEETINTAAAEAAVSEMAAALGIGGRVYTELHPMDKQYMIQTFAGDTVRKIGSAVNFADIRMSHPEAAKKANMVDLIGMGIIDMITSNGDRHEGNFMAAPVDALGVSPNGYEELYIFPIDHGYAKAVNKGNKGVAYAPFDYFATGAGRHGGDIQTELAKLIGVTAYQELFEMSFQQVYQFMLRDNGASFDPQTYITVMKRIETMRALTSADWSSFIKEK